MLGRARIGKPCCSAETGGVNNRLEVFSARISSVFRRNDIEDVLILKVQSNLGRFNSPTTRRILSMFFSFMDPLVGQPLSSREVIRRRTKSKVVGLNLRAPGMSS